jgi:hypothetical protein
MQLLGILVIKILIQKSWIFNTILDYDQSIGKVWTQLDEV